MTIRGSRLIPTGILAALALPIALSQSLPAPVKDTPKALPEPPTVAVAEPAPPRPPKVVCSGDQLTISAANASLESILVAVRGCSGAKIEIPASAATTRTYDEIGPGPIRKVLDDLLSGTEFNYVIQSPDGSPQRVESVVLSMRKSDSTSGNGAGSIDSASSEIAMTPGRKKWLQMQKFDKPDPASLENGEAGAVAEPAFPAAAAPDPAPPAAAAQDAGKAPAQETTAADAAPPPPPPAATSTGDPSKVTEDKITSMQQLFDQRRDMIQKQNVPAAPSTPN